VGFTISKEFTFDAAHQLKGLPDGHKCGNLHGHTYTVRLTLGTTELDEHGFVRDYGDLGVVKTWIDERFDHRHLNDTIYQPTAENLAKYVFEQWQGTFPELLAVGVSETPKTWAFYSSYAMAFSE
jgi:6-pyruvoyltetrahydropterin/6-carboxytetrahydropterin synthase